MEQSAEIDQLTVAMLAVQSALPVIPKTKTADIPTKNGGKYSYNYADLSDCVEQTRPILLENKLVVTQPPDGHGLTTQVMHTSGQWMRATMDLHQSSTPQEQGSSITYARRYAWCSTLGLLADEDDDGAAATHSQNGSRGQQRQSAPAQSTQTRSTAPGTPQDGKKRTQYSWVNNGQRPNPDPKANLASEGQHNRLYAICKSNGYDNVAAVVAAMFPGVAEEQLNWKQITYLSDAVEDGWRPPSVQAEPEYDPGPPPDQYYQGEEQF